MQCWNMVKHTLEILRCVYLAIFQYAWKSELNGEGWGLVWLDIHVFFLRDLVPFVQFKKRKKQPWRSVWWSCRLKPADLLTVTLLHGCFLRYLNCTNSTKSRKASHIYVRGFTGCLYSHASWKSNDLKTCFSRLLRHTYLNFHQKWQSLRKLDFRVRTGSN